MKITFLEYFYVYNWFRKRKKKTENSSFWSIMGKSDAQDLQQKDRKKKREETKAIGLVFVGTKQKYYTIRFLHYISKVFYYFIKITIYSVVKVKFNKTNGPKKGKNSHKSNMKKKCFKEKKYVCFEL